MSTIVGGVTLITVVLSGYIYIDEKKADEVMVAGSLMEQRLETIDYQLEQKTRAISRINKKVKAGKATQDDFDYLEDLNGDKEWLKNRKQTIQKK